MNKTVTIIVAAAAAVTVGLVFRGQVITEGASTPEAPVVVAPVAAQPPVAEPPIALPMPSESVKRAPLSPPTPSPPPAKIDSPAHAVVRDVDAQEADAATVLKRAAAAYETVRSMRADFSQWQENPLLGKRTTSRGTVFQRQPDRFLMRFSQPDGDVIVSDGEYFWLYYPSVDAKQVMRSRAVDVGGLDLQAQFIGDPTKRYTYTDQGSEDVAGRPARVFTLVPRQPAGYKSLKVWIDKRDHLVRRFELEMENGVRQHFDLNNLQVNPTLSNELFRFTPPAGARIIER